jgi:hypothetical protein
MTEIVTGNIFVMMAAVLALVLMAGVGRWVPAGNMDPVLRPWLGWSVAAAMLTVVGVMTPVNMNWVCVGLALVGMAGLWYERRVDAWHLLVFLPFLVVMLGTGVALWDDFAHRLPNTRFLWDFGRFPHPDLPAPSGNMPAYPYAGNWLGAWVNLLLGRYAETGQAIVQVGLFGTLAVWLGGRMLGEGRLVTPWFAVAFGLILLAVSPVFQPALVASAYNDAPLGWVVMLAVVYGLKTLDDDGPGGHRWVFALLMTLGVMLKDTGVLVCGLVGMAMLGVGLWRRVPLRVLVHKLWPAAVLSVGMFGLWKAYGMMHLPVPFFVRPMAEWNWAQVPQMGQSLRALVWAEPQHYVVPVLLLVLLLWRWWKGREMPVLVGVSAAICWGWAAMLGFMYLTAFSPFEGGNLASLDRYLQHVNWLGWVALVDHWRPLLIRCGATRVRRAVVVGAAMVLPLLLHSQLVVRADPQVTQLRAFTRGIGTLMPDGSKMIILDMAGSGYAAQVITYELGHRVRVVRQINAFIADDQLRLADYFREYGATHLLVLSVNDATRAVLGNALPKSLPQLYECAAGTLRCVGKLGG